MIIKIFSIAIALIALVSISIAIIIPAIFSGEDHSQFDLPEHSNFGTRTEPSSELSHIIAMIKKDQEKLPDLGFREKITFLRQSMDERGLDQEITSYIQPVKLDDLDAEWIIAPGAKSNRRILYIHGGAYMIGSPKSHRKITDQLSKITGASVLAIDYRLLPEHTRMDGIEDCRNAYQWILHNGPDGLEPVKDLFVIGDSSGGNLVLSTLAWVRDNQLKPANGAITFSPQTDLTLSSPSLRSHIESDIMQGQDFGSITKAPQFIRLGFSYFMHRINPKNPIISPLLGDLSNLPPQLIQVSSEEMFYDDAIRYANKANAQGSKVIVQSWPHVMHVWQAFDIPEADEAFSEIEKFIQDHLSE